MKENFIDLSNVGFSEEDIKEISQIYIVACGSAYHVGIAAQYVIEDLAKIPVRVELGSEFRYRNQLLLFIGSEICFILFIPRSFCTLIKRAYSLNKIFFYFHKDMVLENTSESLVIIGNGFDLMHGVESSYWDFQKTIGKNSSLRFYMETYLDTSDLWSNLEESLGKLNYSIFLNPGIIDMWLDNFGAYDPDAQAADFFAAVETAIAPTFEIPRELKQWFKKWIKTLVVQSDDRPFLMLHGDYKVLSFNYTEFIETLYGAKSNNVCYIHGCRKNRNNGKPSELILGHRPGMEDEQWDKVKLKPFKFKDPYKRYIMESALETAAREAAWYEEETTKKCSDIIKKHRSFFEELTTIKYIFVIGHSLSEVDYPYFEEICKKTNAKWYIGYHSLDDLKSLLSFVDKMNLREITVFRS